MRRAATATHKRARATVLALVVAGVAGPAAAQSLVGPIDRSVVAIQPVHPAPAPGFLRLPETRSLPTSPARMPHDPAQGVDALGRITSILEYTPGRFER